MTANRPATAPNARCHTCGARFRSTRTSHVHCSADCRRLAARLMGLRDLADAIVDGHASATRSRAVFALRRVLTAVVSGEDLPGPAEKADRHADGSDRRRRWCSCCRHDLGPVAGRGRPATSCAADSGRACARFRNRAQEVVALTEAVVAVRGERARLRILGTVTEINAEIGL